MVCFYVSIYLGIFILGFVEWYFEFGNELTKEKIKQHQLTKEQKQILANQYRENMDHAIKQQKLDRIIETPEYLAKYMPKT